MPYELGAIFLPLAGPSGTFGVVHDTLARAFMPPVTPNMRQVSLLLDKCGTIHGFRRSVLDL